jgi:predicted amino acid dehydrogenase
MVDEILKFSVKQGHVTDGQGYVYCWFHPQDKQVMYVGATWMHPAARAELHLHGIDEAARKVGSHLQQAGVDINEAMQVIAFVVPEQMNRQTAKNALIQTLHAEQKLSFSYFGSEPQAINATDDTYLEWARQAVKHISTV